MVHYWPAEEKVEQPYAAIVSFVHDERCVGLFVVHPHGRPIVDPPERVQLLQDNDKPPQGGNFATWMDFQKGQAAKTDTLTPQVTEHEKFIRELYERVAKLEQSHACQVASSTGVSGG